MKADPHQRRRLAQRFSHVPNAHCTVMRRSLRVPCSHKPVRPQRKAIAAVGIANLQNFSRHALTLSGQQLEPRLLVFNNREQRYRSVLHAHLD